MSAAQSTPSLSVLAPTKSTPQFHSYPATSQQSRPPPGARVPCTSQRVLWPSARVSREPTAHFLLALQVSRGGCCCRCRDYRGGCGRVWAGSSWMMGVVVSADGVAPSCLLPAWEGGELFRRRGRRAASGGAYAHHDPELGSRTNRQGAVPGNETLPEHPRSDDRHEEVSDPASGH